MKALLLALALCLAPRSAFATPPATCTVGNIFTDYTSMSAFTVYLCTATNTWTQLQIGQSSGVPSGAIIFVNSGSCPAGYNEVAGLSGNMMRGTTAAAGNVGTTGGSDSVTPTFTGNSVTSSAVSAGTPAGTNSAATFTGTPWSAPAIAWPAGVPTNAAISAGTPAGTNSATATSGNCAATNIAAGTGSTTACKATAPNLTVPAETFTGSALATHTHTVSWPAGVPTIGAYTPAGTESAATFTGTALGTHTHTTTATGSISAVDTRAAFIYLIGCQKT